MKKVNPDILQQKKAALNDLTRQADLAVDVVSRTISSLGLINQEIEDAVAEIESYSKDLETTRQSLKSQHRNNAALIANFSKLLSVE